jgi:hypothetical protein
MQQAGSVAKYLEIRTLNTSRQAQEAVPILLEPSIHEREDTESCSHFRFIFGCYSSLRKV